MGDRESEASGGSAGEPWSSGHGYVEWLLLDGNRLVVGALAVGFLLLAVLVSFILPTTTTVTQHTAATVPFTTPEQEGRSRFSPLRFERTDAAAGGHSEIDRERVSSVRIPRLGCR